MSSKETRYDLVGNLTLAVQHGTEPIDLSAILKEPVQLIVQGDGFRYVLDLCLPTKICRIGLTLTENVTNNV